MGIPHYVQGASHQTGRHDFFNQNYLIVRINFVKCGATHLLSAKKKVDEIEPTTNYE